VLTVTDAQNEYAESVRAALAQKGIRVEADTRNEKLGYKVREAQLEKIPYMLVCGDKEKEAGAVNVRWRDGDDPGLLSLEDAADLILAAAQEPFERGGMSYSFSTSGSPIPA
jgi:threonyl-tRNA synthetase